MGDNRACPKISDCPNILYDTGVICEIRRPYEIRRPRDYFKELIEIMYIMFIKLKNKSYNIYN